MVAPVPLGPGAVAQGILSILMTSLGVSHKKATLGQGLGPLGSEGRRCMNTKFPFLPRQPCIVGNTLPGAPFLESNVVCVLKTSDDLQSRSDNKHSFVVHRGWSGVGGTCSLQEAGTVTVRKTPNP